MCGIAGSPSFTGKAARETARAMCDQVREHATGRRDNGDFLRLLPILELRLSDHARSTPGAPRLTTTSL
jgi:hypothetical protein